MGSYPIFITGKLSYELAAALAGLPGVQVLGRGGFGIGPEVDHSGPSVPGMTWEVEAESMTAAEEIARQVIAKAGAPNEVSKHPLSA